MKRKRAKKSPSSKYSNAARKIERQNRVKKFFEAAEHHRLQTEAITAKTEKAMVALRNRGM